MNSDAAPSRFLICGIDAGDSESIDILTSYPPAGVILFAHNIISVDGVRNLTETIHSLPGRPFVAIDHEGGPVNRLKELSGDLPAAAEYGKLQLAEIEEIAYSWGTFLASLGIEVNFAPVLDLGPPRTGSGLEERTLSDDPEKVALRARAFIKGMTGAGITCCLKHFPGLGLADLDTHQSRPIVLAGDDLHRHLSPFRELLPRVKLLMVSHAVYPEIDPERRPACFSPPLLSIPTSWDPGVVLISDDLEMGALNDFGELPERAYAAVHAGCDLVIVSHDYRAIPSITEKLYELPDSVLASRKNLKDLTAALQSEKRDRDSCHKDD